MGHSENLSHSELAKRLENDDFECRDVGCTKNYSYEIDERFWNKYVMGRDRKPHIQPDLL